MIPIALFEKCLSRQFIASIEVSNMALKSTLSLIHVTIAGVLIVVICCVYVCFYLFCWFYCFFPFVKNAIIPQVVYDSDVSYIPK